VPALRKRKDNPQTLDCTTGQELKTPKRIIGQEGAARSLQFA